MPKQETIGRVHFADYTVSQLADIRDTPLPRCNEKREDQCDPIPHRKKWRGGIASWADAENLLNKGWREGAERALALKDRIMADAPMLPKVRRNRRRQCWAAVGESLDVDRAMRGEWDRAWRGSRREQVVGSNKCVTLNVGWGGNSHRSADELFWSGACMRYGQDGSSKGSKRVFHSSCHCEGL